MGVDHEAVYVWSEWKDVNMFHNKLYRLVE